MIATSNGSYPKIFDRPKPARIRKAIAEFEQGKITQDDLARIEDEVTTEVIDEQIRAGAELITDGMIRWSDPLTYFASKLEGISISGLLRFLDTNTYFRQPVAEGAVRWTAPVLVRDFEFARAASRVPVKMILPGPYTLGRLSLAKTGSRKALVMAYAEALNQEAKVLAAAGCPLVQFDEPMLLHQKEDYGVFEDALAVAVKDVPCETAVNFFFGAIDPLYPKILELPVTTIALDFAYHTAKPNLMAIQGAPFTKKLIAGLIDARNTLVEDVAETVEKVQILTETIAPENLAIAPNTGLEYVPRDTAFLKLARCAEVVSKAKEVLV